MANSQILVLRPHAHGFAKDWIASNTCWHLDVRLYSDADGNLYALATTSEGGARALGAQWFALREGYALQPVTVSNPHALNAVTLTVASARAWPWLPAYHWQHLAPLADLWPRAMYKRRSVLFHYIRPNMVHEPTEGILNYYSMTGREARDVAHKQRMQQIANTPDVLG